MPDKIHGTTIEDSASDAIAAVTKIGDIDLPYGDIDTTTYGTTDETKDSIAGWLEPGDLPVDVQYSKAETAKWYAKNGGAEEEWTITYSDSSTWVFNARIKQLTIVHPAADADEIMTATVVLKITSKPTFTAGV